MSLPRSAKTHTRPGPGFHAPLPILKSFLKNRYKDVLLKPIDAGFDLALGEV